MTNKTIIFIREPNVDVPEAYLRKVLAACPSGGGYSIQAKNDQGEPELITDNMDTGVPLSDVQDLLKSAASYRVLFAFNKLEKTDEKFLQPYHVALDGDDILLSFGIDGHFPTMTEAGSTEESLLAQRVMFPNIQKLIKYSAGDLNKFLAELRDPTFVDMVMSRIGDRGAFCFLPPIGEPIWLGKNTLGSTFPWGQTSDTLGYTETPVQAETTVDKKKGWWGKSKGPEVPVVQESVKPAVPAAPPSPPLNIPKVEPDTRITAPPPPTEPPKGKYEAIPKGLSKDQRKKMIRRVTNCGSVLPDNWNVDPFYYWVAEYPKDEKMAALAAANGPKDMRSSQPAPTTGSEVRELREEAAVFLMPKDELSDTEATILKIMDRQGKEVHNPLEAQKREATYPSFSSKFGIKIEQTHQWDARDLRLLSPKAMFHYALELRRRDIEHVNAKLTPTEVHTLAHEELKPASTSTSSATAPVAQTSTKGFWGKKPKAA